MIVLILLILLYSAHSCPENQYQMPNGNCVCDYGYYSKDDVCLKCPKNHYKHHRGVAGMEGLEGCLKCPRGLETEEGSRTCLPYSKWWVAPRMYDWIDKSDAYLTENWIEPGGTCERSCDRDNVKDSFVSRTGNQKICEGGLDTSRDDCITSCSKERFPMYHKHEFATFSSCCETAWGAICAEPDVLICKDISEPSVEYENDVENQLRETCDLQSAGGMCNKDRQCYGNLRCVKNFSIRT